MKTKILLLAAALCMALVVQAQAPQKFNYQGIARTGLGAPLANQTLGLEITILNGTTAQFVERHTATTNAIGLYSVQIGGGTAVTGTMGAVTWSAGNKNIKVGIDPNGGTNYTNMGTTELLSVPYALYAAGGTQGPQGPQGVAGPTGPAGATGANGATGATGPQGPQGSTGPAGSQGAAGPIGPTGPAGVAGPAGSANINGTANRLVKFSNATTGTSSQIFDNGTNVGIGTTTPTQFFTIQKSGIGFTQTDGTTEIGTYVSTSGNAYLQTNTNHPLHLTVNGGLPKLTVATNGMIGIGTMTPTAPLEVKSTSSATEPQLRLRNNAGDGFARLNFQNSTTGAWALAGNKGTTDANSVFNLWYSPTADGGLSGGSDIMSISGQGKVGINTASNTSTDNTYGTLCIRTASQQRDILTLMNSANTARWGMWVGPSPGMSDLYLYYNGADRGLFNYISGAYSSTSDVRLKENITPANKVLDQIKGIEVMHFTYKADESHKPQLGYIAQNLEEHFPEFVNKPNTERGKESFYTVNYAGMSAVAIKAIQEQQEMIEGQQATIEALQQAMAKMQARMDELGK